MTTPLFQAIRGLDESFSTLSLHADDHLAESYDIAPPIGVSTTFRFPNPDATSKNVEGLNGEKLNIYSRESTNIRDRVEAVLGALNEGHAVTYTSGLSAGFAAVIHLKPNRVAIRTGYHGTHGFLKVYRRHREIDIIDIDDPLADGDLVWLESPHNPDGLIYASCLEVSSLDICKVCGYNLHLDIAHYVKKAHAVGAKVLVDATFAPPPLQYPFRFGVISYQRLSYEKSPSYDYSSNSDVDIIMHSTTKYFSGHSDGLGGLLVVKTKEQADELCLDRTYMGTVLGSLETWLLLRSIRTLKLRVVQQSRTATALAAWLAEASGHKEHDGIPAGSIHSVLHASLQRYPASWDVQKQHPGGHGATFSVLLATPAQARLLPLAFQLMQPATSLGGVESLTEWRYPVDPLVDQRLVRVSVGLEELQDLKEDWRRALKKIIAEAGTETSRDGEVGV
ncbi:pyridoxal phosphate-dependent transferase [Endogone sp. FLAS-F59071]|nr:pyridoxal phosphate-dependent transferase [Endogone sp. FLAS-F59071]|eukprot:RUS20627.1 pyridoxal phosphate-dependent transferase [Endogone sp. FLAS-F59071]